MNWIDRLSYTCDKCGKIYTRAEFVALRECKCDCGGMRWCPEMTEELIKKLRGRI